MKVRYLLNLRHILFDLIWSDTCYWVPETKKVKYWEISVRNLIVKTLFWAPMIPDDTWNYQQYITKPCYILQIYWTIVILNDIKWYLTYTSQCLVVLKDTIYMILDNNKKFMKINIWTMFLFIQMGKLLEILDNAW